MQLRPQGDAYFIFQKMARMKMTGNSTVHKDLMELIPHIIAVGIQTDDAAVEKFKNVDTGL